MFSKKKKKKKKKNCLPTYPLFSGHVPWSVLLFLFGLSIIASACKASWCYFDTQIPQNHLLGHPNFRGSSLVKCYFQTYDWIHFEHLNIYKTAIFMDIMPYFNKWMHVYGYNISILWSPIKKIPQTILGLPILDTQFLGWVPDWHS